MSPSVDESFLCSEGSAAWICKIVVGRQVVESVSYILIFILIHYRRIHPNDTAETLNAMDGDVINVYSEQAGGSIANIILLEL